MKTCCVILAIGEIVLLGLWLRDRNNAADKQTSLSNYVATQNNLYPNGKVTNVGTRMTMPTAHWSGSPDSSWKQGGDSMTTNSTGRWAA